MALTYDDENLQRLFAELDPKRRMKALKGGFRRAASKVRKTAIGNLRSSIRSDRDLEKGVRAIVWKRKPGFRVTVGTKRNQRTGREFGYHLNRQGVKKPVLIWAEDGTKWRKTRKTKASRGMMKQYGFMDRTRRDVSGTITEDLQNEIADSVKRVAKKYGCTT